MYMFNRITVNPQLPSRINKLTEISNNLWWSWNTEFLKIFKEIDKINGINDYNKIILRNLESRICILEEEREKYNTN